MADICGAVARPGSGENRDFMPTFGGSYSRCEAVRLQATEGVVVIEHESDFHCSMRTWAENRGNAKRRAGQEGVYFSSLD